MSEPDSTLSNGKPQASEGRRWILVVAALVLAPFLFIKGCNLYRDFAFRDEVASKFGGAEIIQTIQEPDRVTAQRMREIHPDEQPDLEGGGFSRVNYEATAEPISVSKSVTHQLANWLTSGSSYDWGDNDAKSCSPSYGVKLVFERADHHVEVWLCFECDILTVYEPIEYEHARDASGGSDFELIHDELAAIMQELFPDDEAIQTL